MGARPSNLSTSSPNIQNTQNNRRPNGTASGSRGSSHNTNSHSSNPNAVSIYNHNPDNEATDLSDELNQLMNQPIHLIPFQLNEFKCPLCSKTVLPDDAECHFVMCITKPRISYNEDTLTEYKGECVICLEDLDQGNTIARLPCLCIYHKKCIDSWFEINRSCPEHPSD